MPALRCPVCKADNVTPTPLPQGERSGSEGAPTCRRCKADLSLLFALEEHREVLLNSARQHAAAGAWEAFLADIEQVHGLRADQQTRRMRAVGLLLIGDRLAALRQVLSAPETPS